MGVFNWLKKKAAQQSLFNVEINAMSLILDANRADEAIITSGGTVNPADIKRVSKSQQELLRDIGLALANGAAIEDVFERIDRARGKHAPGQGAEMAISHVLSFAKSGATAP